MLRGVPSPKPLIIFFCQEWLKSKDHLSISLIEPGDRIRVEILTNVNQFDPPLRIPCVCGPLLFPCQNLTPTDVILMENVRSRSIFRVIYHHHLRLPLVSEKVAVAYNFRPRWAPSIPPVVLRPERDRSPKGLGKGLLDDPLQIRKLLHSIAGPGYRVGAVAESYPPKLPALTKANESAAATKSLRRA